MLGFKKLQAMLKGYSHDNHVVCLGFSGMATHSIVRIIDRMIGIAERWAVPVAHWPGRRVVPVGLARRGHKQTYSSIIANLFGIVAGGHQYRRLCADSKR